MPTINASALGLATGAVLATGCLGPTLDEQEATESTSDTGEDAPGSDAESGGESDGIAEDSSSGGQVGPCTEHEHCPDSACHLAGDLAGECFAPDEVTFVADGLELTALFESVYPGDRKVVILDGDAFSLVELEVGPRSH